MLLLTTTYYYLPLLLFAAAEDGMLRCRSVRAAVELAFGNRAADFNNRRSLHRPMHVRGLAWMVHLRIHVPRGDAYLLFRSHLALLLSTYFVPI